MKIKQYFYSLSIRKKILVAMLVISIIPIIVHTLYTAGSIYNETYREMIDTQKMSMNWIADRLDLSVSKYMTQFYEFEVNKSLKNDIVSWADDEGELDYSAQERIRTAFYTAISVDSAINSIELHNLHTGEMFVVLRSGTFFREEQNDLNIWSERDPNLQTNLFFMRFDEEILAIHQINEFKTNTPKALVVFHLKKEALGDIIDSIKISEDESIVLLNDQDDIIQMSMGENRYPPTEEILNLLNDVKNTDKNQFIQDGDYFYFYRSVNNSKLQVVKIVPNTILVNSLERTLLIGFLITIFILIAAILFSLMFSKIISKPIIMLSNKMKTVALDADNQTSKIIRHDEIGILQTSFNEMVNYNQKLILQEYQSKIETRDAQIRALQAQMNPHFMYNTLQTIGGMALDKGVQEIYTITLSLSDIMRYSFNFSKEMVSLREEIVYLNSYLFIQDQRFKNRLHVKQVIPESFLDILIPKLIVQPIIENCFKHGFVNKSGDWNITLSTEIINNQDGVLIISDNGLGISNERLKSIQADLALSSKKVINASNHIGLININSRIKLYHGDKYGLTIESTEGKGTVVKIFMRFILRDGE